MGSTHHRLSKSKLTQYDMCSLKFKFQNVLGIAENPTRWSMYSVAGTEFHSIIEKFFNEHPNVAKVEEEVIMNYGLHVNAKWWTNFATEFLLPLMKEGHYMKRYCQPLAVELKHWNEDLNFSGIVDAVFRNPKDDKLVIVDWKTGKVKSRETMRFEAAAYKVLLQDAGFFKEEIKYGMMFFTDSGKKQFEPIEDSDVQAVINKIHDTRKRINNGEFFPNTKACGLCGYSKQYGGKCPFG